MDEGKEITMDYGDIIEQLRSLADPEKVKGMARYGITPAKAFGISIPDLRKMARSIGKDHQLALKLWDSGYRETCILASMVDDPSMVTQEQMDEWVEGFDYWEICDQCCMNLFEKTPFAYDKAMEWSGRDEEFVKRAGFVMMARLAVSDKQASDDMFESFLPIIIRESCDSRNYVKKAVNWALRQMGKRNITLNQKAIDTARKIQLIDSKSARWIASDALRELTGDAVQKRLGARS